MKLVATWSNTLNHEHGMYSSIIDALTAASAVGYPFFTWHDGKVHQVSREFSHKGIFRNLYATPTEYTVEMLNNVNGVE